MYCARCRHQLIDDMATYKLALLEGRPTVNDTVYGHTKMLFDTAKAAMDQSAFVPVLDAATANCKAKLPWLRSKPQP